MIDVPCNDTNSVTRLRDKLNRTERKLKQVEVNASLERNRLQAALDLERVNNAKLRNIIRALEFELRQADVHCQGLSHCLEGGGNSTLAAKFVKLTEPSEVECELQDLKGKGKGETVMDEGWKWEGGVGNNLNTNELESSGKWMWGVPKEQVQVEEWRAGISERKRGEQVEKVETIEHVGEMEAMEMTTLQKPQP